MVENPQIQAPVASIQVLDSAAERSNAPVRVEDRHYRLMAEIRAFEEKLLSLFRTQRLSGTTHTYIGQEAVAVASLHHLLPGDGVFSSHRCHGHYLAAGGDPRALFLEILGDRRGVCGGVGGSQHLCREKFFSNGIQGGITPVATGLALANQIVGNGNLMVCFIGDGTLGEGVLYEAMNIASLWNVPILFVLENNRYAQSTPVELNLAGSMAARFEAFGIEASEIESNDVYELEPVFASAFEYVRNNQRPFCQIVHTYRLEAHSKGDDFRDNEEIERWRKRDPLVIAERRIGTDRAAKIMRDVQVSIDQAFARPEKESRPSLNDIAPDEFPGPPAESVRPWRRGDEPETMLKHLQRTLGDLMAEREDVHILGEDLLDPYGGAFKVTQGLSTRHPDRIWSTPISEAAIVGVANGLALAGLKPVVEIMFGDFITLALDQLINHAGKFARMYGNGTSCPIIVRAPMGGQRGYGPTHSQSLEKLLAGIPGLNVIAVDPIHDQKLIWSRMMALSQPCVYVENKSLYGKILPKIENDRCESFQLSSTCGYFPTTRMSLGGVADAVIVCYGAMTLTAIESALHLFVEEERIVDVVVVSCIAPVPIADLTQSIGDTDTIVLVEEGTKRNGVGAEWLASLHEHPGFNRRTIRRVATPDTIIPNDKRLELDIIPNANHLTATIRNLLK